MITTSVSFIPKSDVPGVRPPIEAGKRDSVWVQTRTDNEAEIKAAAVAKIDACYGIEIEIIGLYNQFGEVEK